MKTIGKFIKRVTNEDGKMEITFELANFYGQVEANKLDKNIEYSVEIKELTSRRTLLQNAYLWALIHEIGNVYGDREDVDVYIMALERANAKYEYIMGLPQIEETLKKNFRLVKLVRYEAFKGKEMGVFKCFIGSSKMDKEEMATLIDKVLEIAEELKLDTNYWKKVLQ